MSRVFIFIAPFLPPFVPFDILDFFLLFGLQVYGIMMSEYLWDKNVILESFQSIKTMK